jgi:ElaB/YqjD/DUF883 family membrane-anchored ribosome-binding protein
MADVGREKPSQNSNKDTVQRPPGFEALRKGMGNFVNPVGVTTQQGEHAQDPPKDVVHKSEDLIRSHPFSSILTAVGLGFLFGLFRSGPK